MDAAMCLPTAPFFNRPTMLRAGCSADEVVGTVDAVGLGIDPQPLFRVAQAAVRHMADEHGLRLTITHAIRRGEPRTLDAILRRLTELTQLPRSTVSNAVMNSSHLVRYRTLDPSKHTRISKRDREETPSH